jgi:pyruvate formate lyase activating enzyme
MQTESGIVFDIKHFAVHDGPGIRTTVFLKGCPLRCLWCHSPESQSPRPEVAYYPNLCISCGACVEACPNGAQTLGTPKILRELCTGVGRCAEECYAGATIIYGREASVGEILEEIDKDRLLYETSGGGVTLSGGEPTMQPGFAATLLDALKEHGYHTALDTSGHAERSIFERVLANADLVLYDLKHMDSFTHEEITGVPNGLILANLERAAASGKTLVVRVPIIPGHNDSPENFKAMAGFLGGLRGVEAVELLPYHNLGAPKYMALGREYSLEGLRSPEPVELSELGRILEAEGLRVVIEGLE